MIDRPALVVLAGVNGAGKSSLGGAALRESGLAWYNPDAYSRGLQQRLGYAREAADVQAWKEGLAMLEEAIAQGRSHAFETTLGGRTITQRLIDATATHEVMVWYCGLRSPELHIERVALRVAAGGHHIQSDKIRQRYLSAPLNLIRLMPHLAALRVYDNSASVPLGMPISPPRLVLHMKHGRIVWPVGREDLASVPEWAQPIVGAALARATGAA